MADDNYLHQEPEKHNGHGVAVFTGMLLGSVAGAVTALLFAPRSGKETREQIRTKATDVRDRTNEKVDETVGQIRARADQIKAEVGSKARNLKQQGQEILVEQLDRVSSAAEAGKKAIQGKGS